MHLAFKHEQQNSKPPMLGRQVSVLRNFANYNKADKNLLEGSPDHTASAISTDEGYTTLRITDFLPPFFLFVYMCMYTGQKRGLLSSSSQSKLQQRGTKQKKIAILNRSTSRAMCQAGLGFRV
jgi:hypothetical protein